MTEYQRLDATVSQALAGVDAPAPEDLRVKITALNTLLFNNQVSADDCEKMAREIEARHAVSMGMASIVDDGEFEPWLDAAKKDIDPFYWSRYKRHLVAGGLPPDVITKLDIATEQVLGRLGNPHKLGAWDRRGMVVGHVQSGKTANYAGLICKAADAGYRLIIVIAGIHNNLRNQTQERIDEGFIGRDTGPNAGKNGKPRKIGVGLYDDSRVPVSLTNSKSDFNINTATTNTSQIESYNVPVVLVIKKNPSTLRNLIGWLRDNSAKGDSEMVDQPMLLIDDEADNASINTGYSKQQITTINGLIRELLGTFHRSCYVAYTATPFANIFIDPDQDDDLKGEDLFPKNFIIGLDAPSNYFGGRKVFIDGLPEEGRPDYLRYIDDNEDLLPISHKITQEVNVLPDSLVEAVRAFMVARTIRSLRGQGGKHCSMLVNASRFTRVQGHLRNRLHDVVDRILNTLRVEGARGGHALANPEIAALHAVWQKEYADEGVTWAEILPAMLDAVAATKVVEVNNSSNGLDYSAGTQTVIAVGGFSLSRGLTLEGLTVTWFLRNTKMYDTLMQMGRWFGYRTGYEDLCRVWMPREAVSWYSHIAEATEELHGELRAMERSGLTPLDFGFAVRAHPSSLLITARNKLGYSEKLVSIGLSSQFVETARLKADEASLNHNRQVARNLVADLAAAGHTPETADQVSGGRLLREVDVAVIDAFLRDWENAEESITTQTDPIRNYIRARVPTELQKWDVLLAGLAEGQDAGVLPGWQVVPIRRKILAKDLPNGFMSIGGEKMRVSSRGVEKTGVDPKAALEAEEAFGAGPKVNYPGKIYRQVRKRPLFVLYVVSITRAEDDTGPAPAGFPAKPVIAWALSLPVSNHPDKRVDYVINKVKQRELFGDADVEDDEMDLLDA